MRSADDATAARIHGYVVKRFPAAQQSLAHGDNLLGSGIVDSLGILDIVDFVEEEFGIVIDEEEFVIDNFQSIDRIAEFVHAKIGAS